MRQVNIYLMTTVKGLRAADGKLAYILEYKREDKEPVTLTRIQNIEQCTANVAEITAATEALQRLTEPCELEIYTDSYYLAAMLTSWLTEWEANGWQTARKKDIANKDEVFKLAELLKPHKYKIASHVKHEYYDWLANELKMCKEKKNG